MRSTILGENIAYFKGVRHDSKIFWSPIGEIEWKSQIVLGQKLGQPTRSVIKIWVSSFRPASLLGLPNKLNGKLCSHGPRRIKIVHQQSSHVLWEKLRPVCLEPNVAFQTMTNMFFKTSKTAKRPQAPRKECQKSEGGNIWSVYIINTIKLWSSSSSWSLWFYLS